MERRRRGVAFKTHKMKRIRFFASRNNSIVQDVNTDPYEHAFSQYFQGSRASECKDFCVFQMKTATDSSHQRTRVDSKMNIGRSKVFIGVANGHAVADGLTFLGA